MARDEQVIGSENSGTSRTQPWVPEGGGAGSEAPQNPGVQSETPENAAKRVNPSAPGETGTTPGTNGK